jgi:hypothetical protein
MLLPTTAREWMRVSISSSMDHHRTFGEGIVSVPMKVIVRASCRRRCAAPLVDLGDTLAGAGGEREADGKAKKRRGKQTQRKRLTNDACDLFDFGDISSNDQHVAIG